MSIDPIGTTHCRVGKITFKDSKIVVLQTRPKDLGSEVNQELTQAAITVNDALGQDLQGYVLVGWAEDGNLTATRFVLKGMPSMVVPEFAKTVLTRCLFEDNP